MKTLVGAILSTCICAGLVSAQTGNPPSNDPSVVHTLKQVEQNFADAIKAADIDKLNQILADDWVILEGNGKIVTKETVFHDLKSGNNKLEALEFGPMDVKVLDNVAVVQGSYTETGTVKGQGWSGKAVFTDVLVKHGDKWMIVRSHANRVK